MHAPAVLSMRRLLVVATALALALVATPALAGPPDVQVFEEEFTEVDPNFCGSGIAVQIDGELRSRQAFTYTGRDGVPSFQENFRASETFTNLDTGASVTRDQHVLLHDLDVVVDDDGLATITSLGTGGERWTGPDGKLVYNDPGQVRFQFVVDTNGTLDFPFDDIFVADLGVVFGSTGRNDLQGIDFCDAMLDVIG
ncbi:hypothetical protein [Salsipaludibacter albus]|uniref:hypothetical protein n=1 Tax=Salsipaludibacter albus TaxID=2849650 RepID=UPI001EE3BD40|nr:hypothetical protein [Salsipaludibacter albus]MBY5163470.1 hypothetical protein [Salsipaludibacter albus]